MSTTTEEAAVAPTAAGIEPTLVERITGLESTVRAVLGERDRALDDRAAAIERAELAESYGVAMDNVIRARDAEIRDLRARLAGAQRAADVAAAAELPAAESEAAKPSARAFDVPRRPQRRKSWRRCPRRH